MPHGALPPRDPGETQPLPYRWGPYAVGETVRITVSSDARVRFGDSRVLAANGDTSVGGVVPVGTLQTVAHGPMDYTIPDDSARFISIVRSGTAPFEDASHATVWVVRR